MDAREIAKKLNKRLNNDNHNAKAIGPTCQALLGLVALEELWGAHEPTERAYTLLRSDVLNGAQQILLRLAFDIYNGGGQVQIVELLSLEPQLLTAVGELLTALGQGNLSLTHWCARYYPDNKEMNFVSVNTFQHASK